MTPDDPTTRTRRAVGADASAWAIRARRAHDAARLRHPTTDDNELCADPVPRHASSPASSRSPTGSSSRKRRAPDAPEPWWIEYPKSFFPVLLIVFLLRSFVAEPFKIPSSSMRPTLEVGDFILVNKFAYGLRLPIIEQKIVPLGDPKRGDVVVFRYPLNPSQDFIKRVIGVGGDTVVYRDKQLTVNGVPWPQQVRRHLQLPRGPALRDDGAVHRDGARRAAGRRSTRSRSTRRCRRSAPGRCGRSPGGRTAITIPTAAASPARFRPGTTS